MKLTCEFGQHKNSLCLTTLVTLFAGLIAGPVAAELVINEIDYDQPGGDFAEFVELKNTGAAIINLDPYSLVLVNGSNGTIYQTVDLPNIDLGPDEYYVLCEDASTVPGCNLDILNSVQNGGPDAVAITLNGAVVDTVSYEGDTVAPYTEGSGVGLEDPNGDFLGISRIPDGNDTDFNNQDFQATCITPGSANSASNTGCTAPAAEKIVINEIDYDQGGSDDAEFIEIYNSGNLDVALDDLEIQLVNGTTGTIDVSIVPTAGTLTPGSYFVICVNATNTANCDLDVATNVDLIADTGPRAVALLKLGSLIDTVSYDGNSIAPYTEGSAAGLIDNPAIATAGLSRFPNGADSDQNSVDLSLRCVTPGAANTFVSDNCDGGAAIEIFAIQGSGLSSPVASQVVTSNDNVVTAVGTDGFFMQTPTVRSDGDPETSDGIFVFTGAAPSVSVGDQVDVTGLIDEFFDHTEFANSPLVSIDTSGNALPAPIVFDALTPSPNQPQPANEMERYEGMLVSYSGMATGASDRFGDITVVASTQRPSRAPGIAFPGLPGLPVWDGNPEIFDLNPDGLGAPDQALFATQTMTASGPLGYSFGDYQVLPTSLTVGATPAFPRAVRAPLPGEMTVATFNVLRFFDLVDDPLTDDPITPPAEFAARLAKYSEYIRVTLATPDVVALQEVENLVAVQAIANKIAADQPGETYSAWLIEGNDVGGIDVAYLTRDATISVNELSRFGEDLLLSVDGSLLFDRPPLILDAIYTGNGADFPITVINLHQRSLGGIDGGEATRVKTKRLESAQEVAGLVQSLQTADPTIRLIVAGDLNAYEFTDGYVDVTGHITGVLDPLGAEFSGPDLVDPDLRNHVLDLPAEERYSFVFAGSTQALDHIASSSELQPSFRDAAFARGNADAPNTLLLATGADLALRVADHDAMVVYYMTDADADGLADDQDNCILVANPSQIDTDGDSIGNRCDADIAVPNDCFVNFPDLLEMQAAIFTSPASPNWNPDADFDGSNFINFVDLQLMRDQFFLAPGPSASGCN